MQDFTTLTLLIRKVRKRPVVTQKELQDNLKVAGATVTQSTISNELHHNHICPYTSCKTFRQIRTVFEQYIFGQTKLKLKYLVIIQLVMFAERRVVHIIPRTPFHQWSIQVGASWYGLLLYNQSWGIWIMNGDMNRDMLEMNMNGDMFGDILKENLISLA